MAFQLLTRTPVAGQLASRRLRLLRWRDVFFLIGHTFGTLAFTADAPRAAAARTRSFAEHGLSEGRELAFRSSSDPAERYGTPGTGASSLKSGVRRRTEQFA